MRVASIILLLISIGLIVGPVGAVVYIYRDDLAGLLIPSEIKGILNGDTSFILDEDFVSTDSFNGLDLNKIAMPSLVGATVDQNTKVFTANLNATNPLNYDLTLNTMSAEVQTPDHQQIAVVNLVEPLMLSSGKSSIATVQGTWTQAGETYILSHIQDSEITLSIANLILDLNGIEVERSEPLTITIPVSLSAFTG